MENYIEIERKNGGDTVKVFAKTFENEAFAQIKKLANYEPYREAKIRIMPDAHAGKGCTVGTTMTIGDAITPNLVGVDIGCFTEDTKVALADGRNLSFIEAF